MKDRDIRIDLGEVQTTLLFPLIARARETETAHVQTTPEPQVEDTTDTTSPTATPESSATDNVTTNETVGSISQEDLDKLKEDLEELEYDDLEGVSED